jgi:cytochrome P450
MNDWGIPVLSPSLMTFGSSGHYLRANGIVELADEELRKKNRKTVGFYRLLSPVVLTIDLDVLTPIFTTHFSSFTNRMPDIGSFGIGKELSKTMALISDAKRWRRIRKSVSPSFSNVQLEKMMCVSKERLDILVKQIAALNGESIDARLVTGKYTMDGFLSAALGFEMQLESLRDFEKQQEFIYMNDIFNPGAQVRL